MTPSRYVAVLTIAATLASGLTALAQAPGVTLVRDRGEQFKLMVDKANELRKTGQLLSIEAVTNQMQRTSCTLKLPKPATRDLTVRQIWQRSHDAHVRVGWHYLCRRCDNWHQNLAGGYFITADGAIATCYHVVQPNPDIREGYLVAANEQGDLYRVTEVLAGNELADTAIIRVKVDAPVKPLPLNPHIFPGDSAWCYSDPLGRSSYFSQGMVNRFYVEQRKKQETVRMEVSTDWAPGSSGAAVVDECGNAIGHVSEISSVGSGRPRGTNQTAGAGSPLIVFHSAARAADVLSLVKPPSKR